MPDVLAIIGAAIETGKKLRDLSQKSKDADTKNAIADLNIALADIKMEVASLKEENLRLKEEINSASRRLDVRSKLEIRDDVYYFSEPVAGKSEGPYCRRCFDAEEQLIHVTRRTGHFAVFGKWACPNCNATYGSG